jgi:hypothetical protein
LRASPLCAAASDAIAREKLPGQCGLPRLFEVIAEPKGQKCPS